MSGEKAPYHSMLINDSGLTTTNTGQSQPISVTTTNCFTPTGQYFVLDPEQTQARFDA